MLPGNSKIELYHFCFFFLNVTCQKFPVEENPSAWSGGAGFNLLSHPLLSARDCAMRAVPADAPGVKVAPSVFQWKKMCRR